MILTPLQKLLKNVEDLGKLIVAKGLKKLPKVKKIAQSGHTAHNLHFFTILLKPYLSIIAMSKRTNIEAE